MITMDQKLVVSSRIDVRDIASLIKAWAKQTGFPPKSISSLLQDAIGTLVQSLEQSNPDIHVETIEEAHEIIQYWETRTRTQTQIRNRPKVWFTEQRS